MSEATWLAPGFRGVSIPLAWTLLALIVFVPPPFNRRPLPATSNRLDKHSQHFTNLAVSHAPYSEASPDRTS